MAAQDRASDPLLDALRAELAALGRVVVAFSGGVDSALLTWVAADTLGPAAAPAYTAVSPSLPAEELEACRSLAAEWGLEWHPVPTDELEDPTYVANGSDRCARCKTALMDVLAPAAHERGATVVLGVNGDDLGDHRPGQRAAAERGARFPLLDAGLGKDDVRSLSRRLGLPTWDKPAAACLASRVPYGTEVTVAVLGRVERAEAAVRALGFDELRIRHQGDTARIEVPLDRLGEAATRHLELVAATRAAGYRRVTLDLEGLRSGNLNLDLDRDLDLGADVGLSEPSR